MSALTHFVNYAAAFEKSYASDDWSHVEPFFSEDAVYDTQIPAPFGGRFEGRAAILAYFKFVLDSLDRRFATREIGLVSGQRVRESGDSVCFRGFARYTAPGVPDLYLELEETVWFEGGRITKLEDRIDEASIAGIVSYRKEHGAKLGMTPG